LNEDKKQKVSKEGIIKHIFNKSLKI